MRVRALITAAVVLVSFRAEGRPWHAVVAPSRAALPAVTMDLGYPGPYVPAQSSPITLRATAGDLPFNGYIGFHFRANGRRTSDTPVIARAVLQPHESWTFSTFATRQARGGLAPLEIAVEWRDASMRMKAFQSAGVPPWIWTGQLMPLRVQTGAAPASALGRGAWGATADSLSDHAQWYAGFSEFVTPVDVWLDLPKRVREAVLGSGIHVVFFGLPRAGQQLDEIDRALLPVTFGNAPLPSTARTSVATWLPDETSVSRPLTATSVIPIRVPENRDTSVAWPRPAQIVRTNAALLLTAAAALVSIAGWLILRRRPRTAMTLALLLSAVFVMATRDGVRPASGVYRYEIETALAPGIVDTLHLSRSYGPPLLPEEKRDSETMRTSLTGAEGFADAEVRTSATPISMGAMWRTTDWNAVTRWSRRRSLGEAPRVRIHSRDRETLVLEYESREPIDFVYAQWSCGDGFCSGGIAVRPGTQGRATIRNAREPWPEFEPFVRRPTSVYRGSTTRVSLVQKRRTHTRVFEWLERPKSGGSHD